MVGTRFRYSAGMIWSVSMLSRTTYTAPLNTDRMRTVCKESKALSTSDFAATHGCNLTVPPGQRSFEPVDRFVHRLVSEAECLVMHRHNVARASPVGHLQGFLGRAMIPYPRPVSPYGHDSGLEGPASAQALERLRAGRVPGKNQRLAFAAQHVPVVTAIKITGPAPAPVLHFHRFNFQFALPVAQCGSLVPTNLRDVPQTCALKDVPRKPCSHAGCLLAELLRRCKI